MRKRKKTDNKMGLGIKKFFSNIKKRLKPEDYSSFTTPEVILLIIISILFGVIMGCILTYSKSFNTVNVTNKEAELLAAYEKIKNNYYEEVSEDDLVGAAIDGMVSSLNDPYSYYLNEEDTNSFNQSLDGTYIGVGVTILHDENNENQVVEVMDNSPAKKAGIKVGDKFLKIDGKDVKNLALTDMTSLIKRNKGEKQVFVVLRDNEEITVNITIGEVVLSSVSSKIIEGNGKNVGYIDIDTFAANTYAQFNKNLKALEKEKIDSLIIDVRGNPGGHLSQVQDILSLFFDKKTVLYQIENKGKVEKFYASTKDKRKYDIVVLIDCQSASASEILASCFQENYKNATIIGTTSYGKGTVQKTYELSNGASLKYTAEKWLTSKGNWINDKGVVPDIEVELTEEYYNNACDENDLQLQKALEVLTKK